jgi:cyanophycinase
MGFILLAGGSEFNGQMAIPDRVAIEKAGGSDSLISIIPAAAAPDNNHQRAGQNGKEWFTGLGATHVTVVPLIDRESADFPEIIEILGQTKLFYLLGGFPGHLAQTLKGSLGWQTIITAWQKGAVIAGSSAGAMVLCEYFYNPKVGKIVSGLNLMKNICILPHHNTFGKGWAPSLKQKLPQTILVGIDEETACINVVSEGDWRVYGRGEVTLYQSDQIRRFSSDQEFELASGY